MKLLLGSNNRNKANIVRNHVIGLPVQLLLPEDVGISVDPPENESTALDNAREKALAFYRASRLPCVAEDSGLVFLDLPRDHPDQPGIHVRRASGREMTDAEMTDWFAAIAHRHGGRLRAAWLDAWALVVDDDHVYTFEASPQYAWSYWLVDTPCATYRPGWPLDSISISPVSGLYKTETRDDPQPFYFQEVTGNPARDWMRDVLMHHIKDER